MLVPAVRRPGLIGIRLLLRAPNRKGGTCMSEIQAILQEMRQQRRDHDRDLLHVDESAMNLPTSFALETMMTDDQGSTTGVGVGFLFQRRFDHLEEHAIQIEDHLQSRFGFTQTQSQRYWATNQEARGDLWAALIGLDDTDLDDIPKDPPGEWPLRTTLTHILNVETSYRERCRWAIERYRAGEPFEQLPQSGDVDEPVPSIDAFIQQLDEERTVTIDTLADSSNADLRAPTVWAGIDCDIRFRFMRFAQHEREHTAHIRKWRAQTGKTYSEAARYLGMCWQRHGRLEAVLCGATDDLLDRDPGDGEWTVREILNHIASAERYFKSRIDAALA